MNLVTKKKILHNDEKYLIDIEKRFFNNVNGTDYYYYRISIYDGIIKQNHGLKKLFFKEYEYNCLATYDTYWLNYYSDYKGDINKVIEWAFKKYDYNMRELKTAIEKENEWGNE